MALSDKERLFKLPIHVECWDFSYDDKMKSNVFLIYNLLRYNMEYT